MKRVLVTRHPAAVEFIARQLAGVVQGDVIELGYGETMRIVSSATADDVREAEVYGNVPLHLAALAISVVAIEFEGTPPRGQEYTLAEMIAAGARLTRYCVRAATTPPYDAGEAARAACAAAQKASRLAYEAADAAHAAAQAATWACRPEAAGLVY